MKFRIFVLGSIIALLCFANAWFVSRGLIHARFINVSDIQTAEPDFHRPLPDYLRDEFPSDDPVELLQQVMNMVTNIETYDSKNSLDLYHHVKQGGGLVCSGMALLYLSVLQLKGIPARMIWASRNLYDFYDVHATVEIYHEDKWIIMDPTFCARFEKDGEPLSAQDVHQLIIDGNADAIEIHSYGPVNYLAQFNVFYLKWIRFFNNVALVHTPYYGSIISKLPVLKYWFGTQLVYQLAPPENVCHYQFHNALYLFFMVVLPCVIGMLLLIVIYTLWRRNRSL